MSDQPRIAALEETALDADQRDLLDMVRPTGAPASNVFRTLLRHPKLYRSFVTHGGRLMYGALPLRARELAILRIAWRYRSSYEWGQHEIVARNAGFTTMELTSITRGAGEPVWNEHDASILTAVDELLDSGTLSDESWDRLSSSLDEQALLEFPLLVGHFLGVAFFLRTIGVEPEPDLPCLPTE